MVSELWGIRLTQIRVNFSYPINSTTPSASPSAFTLFSSLSSQIIIHLLVGLPSPFD